jgi:hypothetical protein
MHALPYVHPAVRDLAWSLGSAPLLSPRDSAARWPAPAWYAEILADFHPHLLQLDRAPQPLLDLLAGRTDRRLGSYFETLWRYWLAHNPRYHLLAANLPVRDGGRTLGEFDLIVADRSSGRTLHWELALKFYLGQGDTADPGNWWGPGRRDRLAVKTAHLLQHQTRLAQHPQARRLLAARGLRIDASLVVLKGRLFYPAGLPRHAVSGSCPVHLRGNWLRARQLAQQTPRHWQVLEKHQWLAPLARPAGDLLSNAELAERCYHGKHHPVCAASFADAVETGRWFVVPDDWSARGLSP